MERQVTRVTPAHYIPDAIMAKNIVIAPGQFQDYDPALMYAEDWFKKPGGFPSHPHRGFETVTLILEGACAHEDSAGNSGVLTPGDVQWMTAGRGVLHSELPHGGSTCHSLQLWVNLPSSHKMMAPRYQDVRVQDAPVWEQSGAQVRVISGTACGLTGPVKHAAGVMTFVEARLQPVSSWAHTVADDETMFVYVISGSGTFGAGAVPVSSRHTLLSIAPAKSDSSRAGTTTFTSTATGSQELHLVLFSGKPIGEPVVQHGPFVMNTEAEIQEAFEDYRAGKFGPSWQGC